MQIACAALCLLHKTRSRCGVSTAKAPFSLLTNGCAKTLKDRFGACGGDKHGSTAQLLPAEVDALVAYLETL